MCLSTFTAELHKLPIAHAKIIKLFCIWRYLGNQQALGLDVWLESKRQTGGCAFFTFVANLCRNLISGRTGAKINNCYYFVVISQEHIGLETIYWAQVKALDLQLCLLLTLTTESRSPSGRKCAKIIIYFFCLAISYERIETRCCVQIKALDLQMYLWSFATEFGRCLVAHVRKTQFYTFFAIS